MATSVSKTKVFVGLFVAIAAISFAAPFFRKAAPTHPLAMATVRLALSALLMLPFSLLESRNRRTPLPRNAVVRAGVLGGVFYAVHFGAWI
ncbi:MAG: hypothetical protein KC561_07355, partial [Myxococcales bacterium]|nr:hypothetical protein [Myxococcales bacterium]